MKHIFLISGKARIGKDTFASMVSSYFNVKGIPSEVIHFADKLKEVATFMGWDGKKDDRGRTLLQKLGTEVGREYDKDLWVKFVSQRIINSHHTFFFIPDWRYPNEHTSLSSILLHSNIDEGVMVHTINLQAKYSFENDLSKEQQNHPSEIALNNYNYDVVLYREDETINSLSLVVQGISWIESLSRS